MHPLLKLLTVADPLELAAMLPQTYLPILRVLLGGDPDDGEARLEDRDPEALGKLLEGMRWLTAKLHRPRTLGVEHVPSSGPGLLVGNHNGGLVALDWVLTMIPIWEKFGPERAVYGLGHDFVQWSPLLRKYAAKMGGLRAGHDTAQIVFAAGHLAIVYPGSDYDSFRPFSERNRVVLAGRTGFVSLALRAQVPIIPVVTAGAQEQWIVLTRGEELARALGLKERLRTNVFPIALSFPWGLTSGYLPYLPLPTQITTAFLPPMRWPDLGPEAADDDEVLQRCYAEVETLMQAKMDELTRGRVPLLGQPRSASADGDSSRR
jgi:1-acyl-sn-glycerol-3-phosphate acyltransferase